MSKKRKNGGIWVVLFILIAAMVIGTWWVYRSGFDIEESTYLYIDTDDDVDSVAQKVERQTKPESMRVFHLYAGLLNLKDKIRTGRYEVTPDLSMLNLIRNIRNHNEKPIMLVVPSTRTMDQMAGKLANQLMADSASIAQYLNDESNMKALGYTKEMITGLKGMPLGVKSLEKKQIDLIQRLFKPNERSGVNATRLVTRAFELRILDIDNLEPDDE